MTFGRDPLLSRSGNGLKFKADLQLVAVIVALVSPDIQTVAAIEEGCAIGNVYSKNFGKNYHDDSESSLYK